jgi:hypothetical protein
VVEGGGVFFRVAVEAGTGSADAVRDVMEKVVEGGGGGVGVGGGCGSES